LLSGFIAGHVIAELLENGYNVKATVRGQKNKDAIRHLLHMKDEYAQASTILELCDADLLVEGSFDDIIKGQRQYLSS